MKANISNIKYKNANAVLMESDSLAVTIIPESGAKIQSIYDKDRQKEFLYQSEGEKFHRSSYDSRFEDGDFSGFDEVFPQ
jgi:hypothetical protein